jgi:hypothetical protein
MNTTGWGVDSIFHNIGVTWTRLDVGQGGDLSQVDQAIADGMHVLPILSEGPDSNCTDLSPAQVGSDVAALAPKLKSRGITTLEICNESYLSETDAAYAAQYNAAHVALAGTGIKALAVATALSTNCGAGPANPNWIPNVIKDLPGGASEVDAWTIHPYGPMSGAEACSANPNGYGWANVTDWHNIAVAAGSTAPWYITEVGHCLSGCSGAVSQAAQAADMTQYLNDAKKMPWVAYIDFYTCRDDSSGQYGLLNNDNSPRPSFSALQSWMSINGSQVNG